MKAALITGCAGFVGRAFTKRLLEDGWWVHAIDDLSSGIRPADGWAFPPGDDPDWWYRNSNFAWGEDSVRTLVRDSKPDQYDLIIHCAAVVGGRLKIDGDPLAVATDLAIDSDFFNWVVKAKNRPKVIYFSSSAVYTIELQSRQTHCSLAETLINFDASRIGMPDQTYGWAKLTGELLAKHAVEKYNADVVIYRPFSGYGEDQSLDYPFPSIIRRVVNRENPITIWGSGEQCRDFIHIDDVVEAVLQTKDVLKPGEVLNLGSGVPTSFMSLVCQAHKLFGTEANLECDTTKPEGVFYRVADNYKLRQLYTLKVSLEEGIRRVANHLKKV